jgi:large subunit ribosomal protein L22
MKSTATLKYLRMAPRKVRLVANVIKGKNVAQASDVLSFGTKRAAEPMLKVLRSAVAASSSEESNLFVANVVVNEGPKLKRFRARARGSAYRIHKKTSHVTIVVDEIEEGKAPIERKPSGAAEQEPPKAASMKKELAREKPTFRAESSRVAPKKQTSIKRFFQRKSI